MANRFAVPIHQLVNDDASGSASGWKWNFYTTGTSTRKDTFSDNALTSANANPVVADSSGRFGDIFLEDGTYKVVLTDADDVEKWTADPVAGSLGATGEVRAEISSTAVTTGDATKTIAMDATSGSLTVTLLAAATATNGFEVTIKKTDSSANAVTIDGNGAETVDGAATLVLRHQNHSVTLRCDGSKWLVKAAHRGGFGAPLFWQKGADIASAATLVLGTDGNFFDVTGTTAISGITVAADTVFMLQFDGVLALNLPGVGNITTAAGDALIGFATAADTVQVVSYTRAKGILPRSYLAGLTLSNDTDTDHDINVTAGEAQNATDDGDLVLASEQTKRIDASWATGNDAGGLSSSLTVANDTWYHVHLVLIGGVVEVGFDTSVAAANLITDHSATKFRRIGSVFTNGSANIIAFTQLGDEFLWSVPVAEWSTTNPGTSAITETLTVPTGVAVRAQTSITLQDLTPETAVTFILVTSPDQADTAPSSTIHDFAGPSASSKHTSALSLRGGIRTNTSGQIRYRLNRSTADHIVVGTTHGWIDRRGRED